MTDILGAVPFIFMLAALICLILGTIRRAASVTVDWTSMGLALLVLGAMISVGSGHGHP